MTEERPYPALLRVAGKCACVVGGGRVASHRVAGLLDAGAQVRVIAPEAAEGIRKLAAEGRLQWHREPFAAPMLRGAALVVCATSDPDVNRAAAHAAKAMGALVNMAAPPLGLSDFTVPAGVRRGDLLFTASTGGKCPELSRRLRRELLSLADVYAPWLERLAPIRAAIREQLPSSGARRAFWRGALSDEAMALVRAGKIEEAEAWVGNAVDRSRAEP